MAEFQAKQGKSAHLNRSKRKTTRDDRSTVLRFDQFEDRIVPAFYLVTGTADSSGDLVGPGTGTETDPFQIASLRSAIEQTNANLGADTIILPTGNYLLTLTGSGEDNSATGDLDISDALSIQGDGAGLTVVDASGLTTDPDRVFHVLGMGMEYDVVFDNMTITGGQVEEPSGTSRGGGIYSTGPNITISNSTISNNRVIGFDSSGGTAGAASGGGVFIRDGQLQIISSTISNNEASGGYNFSLGLNAFGGEGYGGGVYMAGLSGGLTITDSTLSSNLAMGGEGFTDESTSATTSGGDGVGGGLYFSGGGSVILTNVDIEFNTAIGGEGFASDGDGIVNGGDAFGGGAAIHSNGATAPAITGGSFFGNEGFGGDARSVNTVSESFVTGGAAYGGGLDLRAAGGTAEITGTIFEENVAFGGEGFADSASVGTATVSGGDASGGGMAFAGSGGLTITDASFIENAAIGGEGQAEAVDTGSAAGGDAAGGGLYTNGSGAVLITNGDFEENYLRGGYAYVSGGDGTWNLNGGDATGAGAAINSSGSVAPVITGSSFFGNEGFGGEAETWFNWGESYVEGGDATGGGLALVSAGGTSEITATEFSSNAAIGGEGVVVSGGSFSIAEGGYATGGGLAFDGSGGLAITDSAFSPNAAVGGEAYIFDLDFGNGEVYGGSATGGGASIEGTALADGDSIVITNSSFTNNIASGAEGFGDLANFDGSGGEVYGGYASGGGLYVYFENSGGFADTQIVLDTVTASNNVVLGGRAVAFNDSENFDDFVLAIGGEGVGGGAALIGVDTAIDVLNSTFTDNRVSGGAAGLGVAGDGGSGANGIGIGGYVQGGGLSAESIPSDTGGISSIQVSGSSFTGNRIVGGTGVGGFDFEFEFAPFGYGSGGYADGGGAALIAEDVAVVGSSFTSNTAQGGTGSGTGGVPALSFGFGGDAQGGGLFVSPPFLDCGCGTLSLDSAMPADGFFSVTLTDLTFTNNQAIGGTATAVQGFAAGGMAAGGGAYVSTEFFGGGPFPWFPWLHDSLDSLDSSVSGGELLVSNVDFTGNKASGGHASGGIGLWAEFCSCGLGAEGGYAFGGGLFTSGESLIVEVDQSSFTNNSAVGGSSETPDGLLGVAFGGEGRGGGMFADLFGFSPSESNVTITNSSFSSNEAVGGNASGGNVGTSGWNAAIGGEASGGGVFVFAPGMIIDASTFVNNTAAGGTATGKVSVAGGQFASGGSAVGGGIYYDQDTFAPPLNSASAEEPAGTQVSITNSLIDGNLALGGAAYAVDNGEASGGDASGGGIFIDADGILLALHLDEPLPPSAVGLSNLTVTNNRAVGGFASSAGVTTAIGVEGGDASGGGIFLDLRDISAAITFSTIEDNSAIGGTADVGQALSGWARGGSASGGGLYVETDNEFFPPPPDLTPSSNEVPGFYLGNSLVAGNTAQGGNAFGGASIGPDSSGASGGDGYGGGLYFDASGGESLIVNSTFSGNSAIGGTAATADGTGFANGGEGYGGGISTDLENNFSLHSSLAPTDLHSGGEHVLSIVNVTITDNQTLGFGTEGDNGGGGGIHHDSSDGEHPYILNTIIAGNTSKGEGPDVLGTFNSEGNNLIGIVNGSTGFSGGFNDILGTATNPVNPVLGPLADNGGPTRTHALLAGSPARNNGSDVVLNPPLGLTTDQRGTGFPRKIGSSVDIGAYEADLTPPTAVLTVAPDVTNSSVATGYLFTVQYTDNQAVDVSSLGNGNIRVTGPNGFSQLAKLVNFSPAQNGTPVTATYSIVPPGGSWDPTDNGTYTISMVANQVKDQDGNPVVAGALGTFEVDRTNPTPPEPPIDKNQPVYAVGADAGGGPVVRIFSGVEGKVQTSIFAYEPTFTGGVQVALGDVNGDGVSDLVTGAGPGGAARIRVFDGKTGAPIYDFFAFNSLERFGVSVAVGDVNGDGFEDIIAGASVGGAPHVRVFSGKDLSEIYSFFAYGADFRGGVNVAAGDVDGDGLADIITGAGPGGGPRVRIFSGADLSEIASYFAYEEDFTGGVFVAAGDFNGDGKAEVVTGAGAGGGPRVVLYDVNAGVELSSIFAYEEDVPNGVRVGVTDVDFDGQLDVVTGPGGGLPSLVRIFRGASPVPTEDFLAFDPTFLGGIFVAGND